MTDASCPRTVVRAGDSQEWAHLAKLLTAAEHQRADGYRRAQDRRDFAAARVLARVVVGELTSSPPDAVDLRQRCPTCGSTDHGRPHAEVAGGQVDVSWSHSGGGVAAAASTTPVGIDLERVGGRPVVQGVLSPGESRAVQEADDPPVEFLRWWTRKEALVKVGACAIEDFATIDLSASPDGWGSWHLGSWHDRTGGFVVSVATTASISDTSPAAHWTALGPLTPRR